MPGLSLDVSRVFPCDMRPDFRVLHRDGPRALHKAEHPGGRHHWQEQDAQPDPDRLAGGTGVLVYSPAPPNRSSTIVPAGQGTNRCRCAITSPDSPDHDKNDCPDACTNSRGVAVADSFSGMALWPERTRTAERADRPTGTSAANWCSRSIATTGS